MFGFKINYSKAQEWGRLISIAGTAQIIIQGIGFVCGILIIRLLSTDEYALYTLANTMLGTMVVLADGGITNNLMAQGGRVWNDKAKLGSILVTGYNLRRKIAIASLAISLPVLFFLLRHHDSNLLMSFLIIISIFPAFYATLSGSLLSIGHKLHQSISELKRIEIFASISRLVLLLLLLFIFPLAFVAILIAGFPQIWANLRLKKLSSAFVDWNQNFNVEVYNNSISYVKRILPGSIFYSISGHLTVWLISIFGTTDALAQVGALGRLSMILSLFNVLFATLIIPRFARLPDLRNLILIKFVQIQIGLILIFGLIVILVSMFPSYMLIVLGDSYIGLNDELMLSVAGSCVSLMAGLLFTMASSRNWVINPLISIPITIFSILIGIFFMNLSTLYGVLLFNLFVFCGEFVIYFIYIVYKIRVI